METNNKFVNCDKDISFGQPTLVNRRLTVWDVVSGYYYDQESYLIDHEISLESLKGCLQYCSNLDCQKDSRLIKFCSGCILSAINSKEVPLVNPIKREIRIGNEKFVLLEDGSIYLGSMNEHEDDEFGYPGWLFAEHGLKEIGKISSSG